MHSYQSFCVHVPERDRLLHDASRRTASRCRSAPTRFTSILPIDGGPAVEVRGTLEGSTYAFDHCLALPLFHELTFEQQDEVVSALCGQLSEAAR